MRIVVVLPAPFGPEDAVDRAARHREVDAVDGARVAEGLDEARGLDRESGLRAHVTYQDRTGRAELIAVARGARSGVSSP